MLEIFPEGSREISSSISNASSSLSVLTIDFDMMLASSFVFTSKFTSMPPLIRKDADVRQTIEPSVTTSARSQVPDPFRMAIVVHSLGGPCFPPMLRTLQEARRSSPDLPFDTATTDLPLMR